MNKPSLSSLYRRLTACNESVEVDAAALTATLARQPVAAEKRAAAIDALSESAAHADLARMLTALRGDSALLAEQVQVVRRGALVHARVGTPRRHGHSMRLRWATSLAAGVVLAVAAVSIHERDLAAGSSSSSAPVATHVSPGVALGDSIFRSGYDGPASAADPQSDRVFRSNFSEGGS